MGRKYRNLYDQVCTFENLWLAARKARRGKRLRPDVHAFELCLEENLLDIRAELCGGVYRFGGYRTFTVREPQARVISAAPYRDRVVHHALANVIEPILDRAMIHDSYACRPGKGTHRALDRAQSFLRANHVEPANRVICSYGGPRFVTAGDADKTQEQNGRDKARPSEADMKRT